nr:hypothetical protein [Gemmatimonadota bacterium]
MNAVLDTPVFSINGTTYLWRDVVQFAQTNCEWQHLEEDVRRGIACLKRAEKEEDGPSPDEIQAAAREFRYERDLVSAHDMSVWLERRGLDVEAWTGYIRRALLRRRWEDELDHTCETYPVAEEERNGELAAEGFCGGHFARFCHDMAARAAVFARLADEDAAAAEGSAATSPEQPAPGPKADDAKKDPSALETAYRRFALEAVGDRAIREQIASHHLEWIRIHCRFVAFTEESAAREAALCVRDDGLDLEEVARDAGTSVRDVRLYLEEVAPGLRERLLAARAGEL